MKLNRKAIRERCEKATEGPWDCQDSHYGLTLFPGDSLDCLPSEADKEFISHSRTDIPALLDWVERANTFLAINAGACRGEDDECWACREAYRLLAELEDE